MNSKLLILLKNNRKKFFNMMLVRLKSEFKSKSINLSKAKETRGDQLTTVDPASLTVLSALVNKWWDPEGPVKLLHRYNSIRIPFIRDGLLANTSSVLDNEITLRNIKILDVGCGGGIVSEALAKLGASVTGIDASVEQIQCAQEHCTTISRLDSNLTYYCTTVEDHVVHNEGVYDGVVASEIIEHVINKPLFVQSCVSALKPGGRIFFTTPNRTRYSQLKLIFFTEYIVNAIPVGTHQYELFIKPEDLREMLQNNNCVVEHVKGIELKYLKTKWEWTTSTNLMYALQAKKMG